MKRALYFFALLIGVANASHGQEIYTTSYMEKTSVSPKMGIQIGYEFKGGYMIGGFYQKEVDLPRNEEVNKPRFYEQEFYGVSFAGNVFTYKNLDAQGNVRTGVSNNINFCITPSIMLDYRLIKLIHIKGGIGVRGFKPTYQGGISIHMF